jgi:hypothetical protein
VVKCGDVVYWLGEEMRWLTGVNPWIHGEFPEWLATGCIKQIIQGTISKYFSVREANFPKYLTNTVL